MKTVGNPWNADCLGCRDAYGSNHNLPLNQTPVGSIEPVAVLDVDPKLHCRYLQRLEHGIRRGLTCSQRSRTAIDSTRENANPPTWVGCAGRQFQRILMKISRKILKIVKKRWRKCGGRSDCLVGLFSLFSDTGDRRRDRKSSWKFDFDFIILISFYQILNKISSRLK